MKVPNFLGGRGRLVHGLTSLVLGCAAGLPVVRSPRSRVLGLGGDAHIFSWGLQYATYWPTHLTHPWRTDLFFPFSGGSNLAANTFVPFVGLLFAPVTRIFGVQVAYNAAMILSLAASCYVVSRITRTAFNVQTGRSLGLGALFALSAAQTAGMIGHLHLAFLPMVIGLFFLGGSLLQREPTARLLMIGAWMSLAQALVSSELLLITITVVVIAGLVVSPEMVVHCVTRTIRCVLRMKPLQLLVTFLPLVMIAYFGWFAVRGPQSFSGAHQPANIYVTDLASIVVPSDLSYQRIGTGSAPGIGVNLPFTGNGSEWYAYLGVPVLILLVARRKALLTSPLGRYCLATAGVASTLSLGPFLHVWGKDTGIPMPWSLVQHLPVFSSVVPARFSILATLGVIGCLAVLLSGSGQRKTASFTFAVALASMATSLPLRSTPMPDALYRSMARTIVEQCPKSEGSVGVVGTDAAYVGLGLQARSNFAFLLENGFSFRSEGPVGILDLDAAVRRTSGKVSRCILSLDGPLNLPAPLWAATPLASGVLYVRYS